MIQELSFTDWVGLVAEAVRTTLVVCVDGLAGTLKVTETAESRAGANVTDEGEGAHEVSVPQVAVSVMVRDANASGLES